MSALVLCIEVSECAYLKFCVLLKANLGASIIRARSDYCTTLVSVAVCRADYQVIWHEREKDIFDGYGMRVRCSYWI